MPTRRSGNPFAVAFWREPDSQLLALFPLARGSDALLIGRLYGAAQLGLYNRASVLLMRPVQQFISPIEAVFVPMLSRLQNQPDPLPNRTVLQAFEFCRRVP